MSEPKLISPMLDNFDMGSCIGEHNGVCCYPAMNRDSDERYIVKTISIPASQRQLDALLLTGAYPNEVSALEYFKDIADSTVEEIEVMQRLSQLEGFLPFESYQVALLEDRVGYIVYLLSIYRRTLRKHFKREPMTHLGAVNLGLDLCAALAVCRKSGYLYVDLKPSNIYVVNDTEYRIGDLGFIRLDSLKYASLPDKYRSQYTAPEISDAFASLNPTLDIYAAGLILYQAYNGGALPFDGDTAPAEELPPPPYADYEMAEIIMKACALNPEDRWQDPIEMGQAIVSYMQRNGANDTPIIPPIIPVSLTVPLSEEEMDLSAFGITDEDMADMELDIDEYADEEKPAAVENSDADSQQDDDVQDSAEVTETEDAISETPAEPVEESAVAVDIDVPVEDAETPADDTIDALADALNIEQEPTYSEDDFGNLSFLNDLIGDETSPENNVTDVEYGEVSAELSEILSQADELVAHPVPEPVVAPPAIEIPIPDPIIIEDDAPVDESDNEPESESVTEESCEADTVTEPEPESTPIEAESAEEDAVTMIAAAIEEAADEEPLITSSDTQIVGQLNNDDDDDCTDETVDEDSEVSVPVKKKKAGWLVAVIIVLGVAILAAAGYLYYRYFYLQPINTIRVEGTEDSMVVYVDSDIDESLLSIVCSDSQGHQISAAVVGGQASFDNLTPDTAYNVTVLVDGFHRLTGEITASYSTPKLTNIVQFSAVTGTEDGSIILSFTVDGPDSGQWSVAYSAEGEPEKVESLVTHTEQLENLTIGKEYTFTLIPGDDMYVVGTNQLKHTASKLVYANDLKILSCVEGNLTAAWSAPEDVQVTEWTVRCYNGSDYDQTVTTADTSVVFEGIDNTSSYNLDVTAAGMSVSKSVHLTENAITVSEFTADTSNSNRISLKWSASPNAPENGWILMYSIAGSDYLVNVPVNSNSATISPAIPGATYIFTLQDADGADVLSTPLTCTVPDAVPFSGYGITPESISMKMCKTPDVSGWDVDDLEESDYTTRFAVGESISFQSQLLQDYSESEDQITVLYVIRDKDGNLVLYSAEPESWQDMWYKHYGEFTIKQVPAVAGDYVIAVYFNGMFVHEQEFSIV